MAGITNEGDDLLKQQGVVEKEGIEHDPTNPYIAKATGKTTDTDSPTGAEQGNSNIVEGSDSEQTGTSWGLPPVEDTSQEYTPRGEDRSAEEPSERNRLDDVGAWKTMNTNSSPSPPTGNS